MQRRQGSVPRSGPAIAHCGNQPAIGQRHGSQRAPSSHSTPASRPSSGRGTPALPDPAHRGSHRIDRSSAGLFQPRSPLRASGALQLCSGASYRLLQRCCCWPWRRCCRPPAATSLTWCAAALLPPAGELLRRLLADLPPHAVGCPTPDGRCPAVRLSQSPARWHIVGAASVCLLERRLLRRLAPIRADPLKKKKQKKKTLLVAMPNHSNAASCC